MIPLSFVCISDALAMSMTRYNGAPLDVISCKLWFFYPSDGLMRRDGVDCQFITGPSGGHDLPGSSAVATTLW